MAIDYSALLYDPVYAELGVDATMNGIALTVIDDTRPKIAANGLVDVRGTGPGAFARVPELTSKGITRDDFDGATLQFNGRTWSVRAHELRGSPNGEDFGEVRFQLKASG